MRSVKTRAGAVLHYSVSAGDGAPPVVLINSLGTDFRIWDEFVGHLGGAFSIIQYDKRGHGLSSCPPGPYSIDEQGDDLGDLLDHLEVRGAVLVGLSVGGLIAQVLARHRPDLVCGLVLCDTADKIGDPDNWSTRIATLQAGGMQAIVEPVLENWFSDNYRARHPNKMAIWRAMLERTPASGYIATCAGIRDADFTRHTAAINFPTLCICGELDTATPPALMRSFCAGLPGANYHEIPGVGHLPPIEAPQTLATLVKSFIQENNFV